MKTKIIDLEGKTQVKAPANGTGHKLEKKSAWQIIQTYFNLLNHIMIFVVAIYMSFLCYKAGNTAVSWHAWLCTIGYQLLMTEAIMAFYSGNIWSQLHSRNVNKTMHWLMQAVGSTGAIVGMIIEFWNRGHHFGSTHSKIGLAAAVFTALGMLNGVSALWSFDLKTYVKPIYLKLAHNTTGIIAFVLGMVALFYGYNKRYMVNNSREDIRMWLQALAVITILLSLIGALRSLVHQFKQSFNISN